jgi:maleate isomerase
MAVKVVRVGVIKPSHGSSSLQDLKSLLPGDIELVSDYMGFTHYSEDEFDKAMVLYGEKVAGLAAKGVDLIHPEGAPPFMLKGRPAETRLIAEWQKKYGLQVFTTGTTQVAAMRALGIKRFVGYTPFDVDSKLADAFRRYFVDAGFEPLGMGNPVGSMEQLYKLTGDQIVDWLVSDFRKLAPKPEAVYILGSGWRALDAIEKMEAALGVPVLHPVVVRCWYILQTLGRAKPIKGKGRLLAMMPPIPA